MPASFQELSIAAKALAAAEMLDETGEGAKTLFNCPFCFIGIA